MAKTLGVVTSYYPDIQELAANIQSYLPYLDQLIIWENTPARDSEIKNIVNYIDSDKVEIHTTGANEGLGKPFNEAAHLALVAEFDYLLTMDQDSRFHNDDFKLYLQLVDNKKDDSISAFAPNRSMIPEKSNDFFEIRSVISSGAIYPVSVFRKIGFFRDDFFMYMIDIEFCFRASNAGLRSYCVLPVQLHHAEGYKVKNRWGLIINNYSAQSTYYIIRNTILTWKLYPKMTSEREKVSFYKYKMFYRILKLIFENDRFRKFKAIIMGYLHGYFSKSGKYNL